MKCIYNKFVLFFGLILAITFSSCKNFMNGASLLEDLNDTIEYVNASSISVLVSPEEGTGSTVPYGDYKAKSSYPFTVKFTENSERYCFIRWVAYKDGTEITEGVKFENQTAYETEVTVDEIAGIRIVPLCEKRIELATDPSPKYEPNGVSRDRSISVEFTKKPKADCFIFSENELPDGATPVKNSEGQIWAYIKDDLTYLKNISITNSDEISMAEHFTQPLLEGNRIIIAINKEKPIEFEAGVVLKTIKVTLSSNICDENGITMGNEKMWRYQVTESTDEKATIILSSANGEGSVYLAGTKDYNIGQKISLIFTEDPDYQFLYWLFDNSIISVTDPTNPSTTALVKERTTDNATEIKAVCAPRPRVESFSPVNNSENTSVSKDKTIEIVFNKNLPADEEALQQLNNIVVSIGGNSVNSFFHTPTIVEKKITIEADQDNMLEVSEGQTKTVIVSIPADFYYLTENGTKVYYGGNGITYSYVINNTTFDKASVSYSIPENSGSLNIDTTNQPFEYSIGQVIPLEFTTNSNWNFYGWKILNAQGQNVDSSILAIKKDRDNKYNLYVYKKVQAVTISPDCSEQFRITGVTPEKDTETLKDSSITITFNRNIDEACSSMLNKIKIYVDNIPADDFFENRTIQENSIVIENTKAISVNKNSTKQIKLAIPKDFYYKDGERIINLGDEYTTQYKINYQTNQKTVVKYNVDNSSSTQISVGSLYVPTGTSEVYNIDQTGSIAYPLSNGYELKGWKLTAPSNDYTVEPFGYQKSGTIKIKKDNITYFMLEINSDNPLMAETKLINAINNTQDNSIVVSVQDYLIPKIVSIKAGEENLWNNYGYNNDTSIVINFNKQMNQESVILSEDGSLSITKYGNNSEHYESYFDSSWNADKTVLVLKPNIRLEGTGTKTIKSLKNLVPNENDLFDFVITFNANNNNIVDVAGESLRTENNNGNSYVYRINGQNTNRELSVGMSLFKPVYNYDEETGDYKEILTTPFVDFTFDGTENDTYHVNHVGKKLYFDFNVSDSNFGFKSVSIIETLIQLKDKQSVNVIEEPKIIEAEYENNIITQNYASQEKMLYELRSKNDGVVKLEFCFKDFYNNSKTIVYYVIKDTTVDSSLILPYWDYFDKYAPAPAQQVTGDAKTELLKYVPDENNITVSFLLTSKDNSCYKYFDCFYAPNETKNSQYDYKYKTYFTYKVQYGSDINNLTEEGEYNSPKLILFNNPKEHEYDQFKITRNVKENCYIKITAYDEVGNKISKVNVIPKQYDESDFYINSGKIIIQSKELEDLARYANDNFDSKINTYIYYTLDNYLNEDADIHYLSETNINSVIPSIDLNDFNNNGVYRFYVIPKVESNSEDIFGFKEVYPGVFSNPFIYQANSGSSSSTPEFPDSVNIDLLEQESVPGSGYVKGKVKYPDGFNKTAGFSYGVKVWPYGDDSSIYYYDDNEVFFTCLVENNYKIIAIDNSTREVHEDNSVKSIAITYDTSSPEIYIINEGFATDHFYAFSNPNSIYFRNNDYLPNDKQGDYPSKGLYKVDDYYPIEYYIIEKAGKSFLPDLIPQVQLTDKLKKVFNWKRKTYQTTNSQGNLVNRNADLPVEIDIRDLPESYYNVVFDLKDNQTLPNTKNWTIAISNIVLPKKIKLSISDSTNINSFGLLFDASNTTDKKLYYSDYYYLKPEGHIPGVYWFFGAEIINYGRDNNNIKTTVTNFSGSFIKARSCTSNNDFAQTLYEYILPEYYIKKNNGESVELHNKAMIQAVGNSYQLFYDAPCFVHTMCHPKNLSENYPEELAEEDRAAYWETKGKEVGLELVNSEWNYSSSTYTVPVNEIEKNEYYVTIAHFADGTSVMTEVKQR